MNWNLFFYIHFFENWPKNWNMNLIPTTIIANDLLFLQFVVFTQVFFFWKTKNL